MCVRWQLLIFRSPSTALLIKDETRNVFYELEDPRDVQDRCVIKIYCKEPIYSTYPGHHNPHLANGDLRVSVSSVHTNAWRKETNKPWCSKHGERGLNATGAFMNSFSCFSASLWPWGQRVSTELKEYEINFAKVKHVFFTPQTFLSCLRGRVGGVDTQVCEGDNSRTRRHQSFIFVSSAYLLKIFGSSKVL